MPIAATLPTVTNDPTKTILPQNCYLTFLPTSGSAQNFKLKSGSISRSITKIERKVPSTGGTIVRDRTVVTEVINTLKFTLDEFTADVQTLMNTANNVGTARLWVKDPDDAANTAAILTNEFSCTITQEGEMPLDPSNFTEVTFTADILGTFTYTFDGATT